MTARRPAPAGSSRRRVLGLFVAVAAALASSCGVSLDPNVRVVPPEDVPYGLLDAAAAPSPPSGDEGFDTAVCLTVNGKLLTVRRASSSSDLADILRIGPTDGEATIGLRNIAGEDLVSDVTVEDHLAEVELNEDFADLPGDQQLLAVAQITCTASAQPGIDAVSFSLDGQSVDVPIQGGESSARPVTIRDYERLQIN